MTSRDDDVPETAMMSGSDAGEPGEHSRADLSPEELRLLSSLEEGVAGRDAAAAEDPADDPEATAHAAEDETPLPAEGGPQDDGLSARFSEE